MNVGDVLAGRYELVEEIGAGGMGRVLRAQDRTLGRPVAVKLLAPHLLGDSAAIAALRTEAQLAAAVRHPNVVQVLDAVLEDTDQPAIVMEFVDGPSLRDVIPNEGLPLGRALEIAAAVADGLSAVHRAGLVHRDVSPGNVLLDRGVPRLTDFGIARTAAATATQTIRGSLGYLAPEQASGRRVGPQADVYALACLTTLLLTGRPPFEADAPVGVVHQHVHATPPDVRERRPEVPAAVAAAITAALAKDPDDRTASPAAFRQALAVSSSSTAATDVTERIDPSAGAAATTVLADRGDTRVLGPTDIAAGTADEATPDEARSRVPLWWALAATAAVVVLGAMLLPGDAPPPDPVVDLGASPSAEPSPQPSPEPSPEPEESLSGVEATLAELSELQALLVELESDGELEGEAREKLDERVAKAIEKVEDDKPNDAAKELREFRKELGSQMDKDRVSADAELAIVGQLQAAESALDTVPRGEGQGGGGDEEDEDDD